MLVFAALPAFKPLAAVAVLSAIYMGPEFGFLVGSLSAVVSNIFFGQGPGDGSRGFRLAGRRVAPRASAGCGMVFREPDRTHSPPDAPGAIRAVVGPGSE